MTTSRTVTARELDVPLIGYAEAIARVVAAFPALDPIRVSLAEALGTVLAQDLVAGDDIPSFDNSAMDGYAVRSADLTAASDGAPIPLTVADESAQGVAVKVMTGFPIPDGADAVVPWERTAALEDGSGIDRIVIDTVVTAGTFVRPRGEDVGQGDTVLRAGTFIGPVQVGMLAAVGATEVLVHPRPRVGVLSTGDELVGVDEAVGRGRVRDANGPLLTALCTSLGGVVTAAVRTGDDPEAIGAALSELASQADLVISSGGASVGERDWLRSVLEEQGPLDFWRVALRPGKPVALGRRDGAPVIVLPGNPGSVIACTHVFVARAIRCLAGRDAEPLAVVAELTEGIAGDTQRTVVHPVHLDGDRVRPAVGRSSQVLSNALGTDGWVIVPPGGVTAGTAVTVELDT